MEILLMTTPVGKNTAGADKLSLTITWAIDCEQSIVRSSRSSALRYGGHLGWVSNILRGSGTATALNPDARPLGTYKTKMAAGPVSARSWQSYEKIGDCKQSIWASENRDGFDPLF